MSLIALPHPHIRRRLLILVGSAVFACGTLAQPQPWFRSEARPGLPMPDTQGTNAALERCVEKPPFFTSVDRQINWISPLVDAEQALWRRVRESARACYLASPLPARLRVPQPALSLIAGEWASTDAFDCNGRRLRAALAVSIPGANVRADPTLMLSADHGIAAAALRLTDAGSGALVLTKNVLGSVGDSAHRASFLFPLTPAEQREALATNDIALQTTVEAGSPDRLAATIAAGACRASMVFARRGSGPPSAAAQCADEAYRSARENRGMDAVRCRYFEARAVSCGLDELLRARELPVGDPQALARVLQATAGRAESLLQGTALNAANACLQTGLRIAAFELGGPLTARWVEQLNARIDRALAAEAQGRLVEDDLSESMANLFDQFTNDPSLPGNRSVNRPRVADQMRDWATCVRAPGNVILRWAEVQSAVRSARQLPAVSEDLRRYFEWAADAGDALIAARRQSLAPSSPPGYASCLARQMPAPTPTARRPPLPVLDGAWTAVTPVADARPVPYQRGVQCGPLRVFVDIGFSPRPGPTGLRTVDLRLGSHRTGSSDDPFAYAGVNYLASANLDSTAAAPLLSVDSFLARDGADGDIQPVTRQRRSPIVAAEGLAFEITGGEPGNPNLMHARARWQSPCSADLLLHRTRAIMGSPERVR